MRFAASPVIIVDPRAGLEFYFFLLDQGVQKRVKREYISMDITRSTNSILPLTNNVGYYI